MKNKILFIGGTHGDEPIGVEALQTLEKERSDFDWIIGNPKALERNTREFEGDLNRSAPGNLNADTYASRRASEIMQIAKKYEGVIDLHGAQGETGIFIIITNPSPSNFALAARLDIQRIVVWPSYSPELVGPLSENVACGLEIECGKKDDPDINKQLLSILKRFLNQETASPLEEREIYEVYDALEEKPETQLEEFKETTVNNETFFPLLIGSYSKPICYKMRKYEGSL